MYLHSNDQDIEDGIFSLIQQYSSPLVFKYIDAMALGNYSFIQNTDFESKDCDDDNNNLNILLIGDKTMGKTSMLIAYITGRFPYYLRQRAPEKYNLTMKVDGVDMDIHFWDRGHGDLVNYPQTNIFAVCMDVYDPHKNNRDVDEPLSARQIGAMAFVQEIRGYYGNDIPICIVGTKISSRNDYMYKAQCCSTKEMRDFAKYYCGCNNYMECDSEKREGLDELFNYVIRRAVDHKRSTHKEQKSNDKKNCIIL